MAKKQTNKNPSGSENKERITLLNFPQQMEVGRKQEKKREGMSREEKKGRKGGKEKRGKGEKQKGRQKEGESRTKSAKRNLFLV